MAGLVFSGELVRMLPRWFVGEKAEGKGREIMAEWVNMVVSRHVKEYEEVVSGMAPRGDRDAKAVTKGEVFKRAMKRVRVGSQSPKKGNRRETVLELK